MKYVFILLSFLLTTPAHAFWNESAESYYARQLKSCEYKPERESIWDFLTATREIHLDECCADSVRDMQDAGAKRIAAGASCPEGQTKKSNTCPTSKHWCVPAQ